MPNLVNQLVAAQYAAEISDADGMVIAGVKGLTVEELEGLRAKLDAGGASFRMVRNSLFRRLMAEKGFEFGGDVLTGNLMVAYGNAEAAINAAKALTEKEIKKTGKIALRGGVLEGAQLSPEESVALASVPDKLTQRAMLLGVLQAPARGLATVLSAIPSGFARVLQAHIDQSPDGGGDAESAA